MKWLYRITFWGALALYLYFLKGNEAFFELLICIGLYLGNRYAMRAVLGLRKYKVYLLIFLGLWIVGSISLHYLDSANIFDSNINSSPYSLDFFNSLYLAFIPFITLVASFQATVTKDWFRGFTIRDRYNFSIKRLRFEKEKVELNLMTQKLNPHFLKNILTNIHELVLLKKPEAPDAIVTLKEIMDYILYDASQNEQVDLYKEIEFMKQLLELRRLGLADPAKIQVDFPEHHVSQSVKILPFVFLPFIENIFSHCDFNQDGAFAKVSLSVFKPEHITFETSNSYPTPLKKSTKGGIGITTLKRRLEKAYPKKFTLVIEDKEGIYKSKLMLKIILNQ